MQSEREDPDMEFRVRETAHRRDRRSSSAPLPARLIVNADGSAIASYGVGDRLVRYESIIDCLSDHDLRGADLDPLD